MREIKFRAWFGRPHYSEPHMAYLDINDDFGGASVTWQLRYLQHPEPDGPIYMQYTGLKDKNGVEIYEGDVVEDLTTKTYLGSKNITSRRGQVKYGNYYATADDPYCYADVTGFYIDGDVFSNNLEDYFDKELEVIGNIYEHPELLKKGEL